MRYHRLYQQRLLTNNWGTLAQEQPVLNKHALPLPTIIALRPKIGILGVYSILVFGALIFAGTAIWALVLFFTTPYNAYYTGDDPFVAAIAGSIALFFGVLLWVLWSRSRYWVKVTEMGMEARFQGRKMQITWEEARFFSIDRVAISWHQSIYTLSGEQRSVTWMQLMPEIPVRTRRYQPALPFDLYLWQSKALLEVIAGQTGLPLYDVRSPVEKRYP